MDRHFPPSWSPLKHPWNRRDLLAYLDDLASEAPLAVWAEERQWGAVSGFDQIIHFLFDDVILDDEGIGYSLFDESEDRLIGDLKEPLSTICDDLPNGSDEESVGHPLWDEVRRRAATAKDAMALR